MIPTRKRSRHVALLLAGAAVLTLSGCEDEKVDAAAFPNLDACLAAAKQNSLFFTEADCRTQFAEAQKTHLETAPRYESKALCEQEHGVGNCEGDPAAPAAQSSGGGGGIFMPMLMGYMIGSMLGGRGGVFGQPMVPRAGGGFSNPAGTQTFSSNSGTGKVAPATFAKAPSTIGKAPMTRATVAQRGGFGASSTRATSTSRTGTTRSSGG